MPRNTVVNRRDADSPFVRRTMQATGGAHEAVTGIAEALSVSKASIVDTALRHLATMDHGAIVELMRRHGHLTDEEYALVSGLVHPDAAKVK